MSRDSKTITAADYIISFYQEVKTLLNYHAEYVNYLIDLENQHGEQVKNGEHLNLAEQQAKDLHENVKIVRTVIIKVQTTINAMSSDLNIDIDNLKKIYDEMLDQGIIERETLTKYVTEINKIVISHIELKKLSQNAEDFYAKMQNE